MRTDRDPAKAWVSAKLEHDRQLGCCRISPCGRFVAAGGTDEKVLLWDVKTKKKTELEGHRSWLTAMAFAPAGDRIFTADLRGTIRAWALGDGPPKTLWSVDGAHRPALRALAVHPGGSMIATAGDDGTVRLWSPDGKPIRELRGHATPVYSVAFDPDGKALVSGDLSGIVRHWEPETGRHVRDLDASVLHTRKENFLSSVGGVRALAFSPDGKTLAASGLRDAKSNTFCPGKPAVVILDWKKGSRVRVLDTGDGKVDGFVNAVVYLPDGILAGCSETHGGAAGLWFWRPGEERAFHKANAPSGYDLSLHPDGLQLALAAYRSNGRGGNGRPAKTREEYVPHAGEVRIYSLTAKKK